MFYPFCKGSISFHEKLRKGAFLHYIEFLKTRRCNDYAFSKNAAAFYQKSVLTAEDGLDRNNSPFDSSKLMSLGRILFAGF